MNLSQSNTAVTSPEASMPSTATSQSSLLRSTQIHNA